MMTKLPAGRRGTLSRTRAERLGAWSRSALLSVASAVGLVVGLRAIARLEPPRIEPLLGLEPVPREGLGLDWTDAALWPADLQVAALERLVTVLAALVLSAVLVATLNGLILLAEAGAERRNELAVRSAVGATPAELAALLLRSLRALLAAGAALGLLTGLAAGALARAAWPGARLDVEALAAGDALALAGTVLAALTAVYVAAGWRVARSGRAAGALRAGTRTGADPMAIFVRKVLAATHTAIAGGVLVAAVTLGRGIGPTSVMAGAVDTTVFDVVAPEAGAWPALRAALDEVPGLEAESLAAPGALLGLGVRDVAIAECGACSRGLMPAPLWNAWADHYAVAPGYFDLAGVELLAGRAFMDADDAEGEPVAIINEVFAREAFERGQPIGKRVRLGTGFDSWYRVVGVVEDLSVATLGSDELPRAEVYVSVLQRPTRSATVLVRGDADAVEAARAATAALGFQPSRARSVSAYRARAAGTIVWAGRLTRVAAILALLLAIQGTYTVALQTTRRRKKELAVRRAVGAAPVRVVARVLGERLRITGWGLAGFVFFGSLAAALLQRATGLSGTAPTTYGVIGMLLTVSAVVASVRAALEALRVGPAEALD